MLLPCLCATEKPRVSAISPSKSRGRSQRARAEFHEIVVSRKRKANNGNQVAVVEERTEERERTNGHQDETEEVCESVSIQPPPVSPPSSPSSERGHDTDIVQIDIYDQETQLEEEIAVEPTHRTPEAAVSGAYRTRTRRITDRSSKKSLLGGGVSGFEDSPVTKRVLNVVGNANVPAATSPKKGKTSKKRRTAQEDDETIGEEEENDDTPLRSSGSSFRDIFSHPTPSPPPSPSHSSPPSASPSAEGRATSGYLNKRRAKKQRTPLPEKRKRTSKRHRGDSDDDNAEGADDEMVPANSRKTSVW